MKKISHALVPSVLISPLTLKYRERCSPGVFIRAAILLAIPFSAQALPVDPSLPGVQSVWSTTCFNLRANVSPIPAAGFTGNSCEQNFATTSASASAATSVAAIGGIPAPLVTAASEVDAITGRGAAALAKAAYAFSINSLGLAPLPDGSPLPMLINASTVVDANVNSIGVANVQFWRGSFGYDLRGGKFVASPLVPSQLLFGISASVSSTDDRTDFDNNASSTFLDIAEDYWFNVEASCSSNPNTVSSLCAAIADPTIEFDQVRFDQIMGENTFSLADAFQIQYSPGFEDIVIPIPATAWLFGSALGLLAWIRRKAT